jgi:hypothetical protein
MISKVLIILLLTISPLALADKFTDDDTLIIEYDNRSNGIINSDTAPLLQVFGDGKIIVSQPWHRKDQGIYEGQLQQGELHQLLNQLQLFNVFDHRPDFVESLAQSEIAKMERATGIAVHHSETIKTRFAFAMAGEKAMRKSTWNNLQRTSRRISSIDAISQAAQSELLLQDLLDHPSLTRIADARFGGLEQ